MSNDSQPLYVSWADDDPKSKTLAFAQAGETMKRVDNVVRRSRSLERATAANTFMNIAPDNVSIRENFTRRDYEMFRPEEAIPLRIKDIIAACLECYRRIGLVRNVIDLMADFTVQGVDIVHPNPKIQQWHKNWFKRVNGPERSERFANNLLRMGNAIAKRIWGTLTEQTRDDIQQGKASALVGDLTPEAVPEAKKYKIPLRYTFLNPMTIDVNDEQLAPFVDNDNFIYALKIPSKLAKAVKQPTKSQKPLISQIPSNLRKMIADGAKLVPLPNKDIVVFNYKKDDWQVWGEPLIYCIMEDLRMLQKMKLADLAALDGAISHIRLWRLGSLEHKLIPTDAAVNRLATMLINNVGGGSVDLIWGPDLELQETSTDVYKFLGQEKYAPVLNAIYAGLGIPPTLTGGAQQSGFTNNFISLATLTERLNYTRQKLVAFWEAELKLVQQAMGFRFPAQIVFDRPVLTDESARLALLIQLADRDLISMQSLQEQFQLLPEMEKLRIKREWQMREGGNFPDKVSPFHNPNPEVDLKKIALQTGQATPAQVGLELDDNVDGQQTLLETQMDMQKQHSDAQNEATKTHLNHQRKSDQALLDKGVHPNQLQKLQIKGTPGQGRPLNSNDSTKRKTKTVKPRTGAPAQRARASTAELMMDMTWAREAQKSISEVVHPAFLQTKAKKNVRQLTEAEVIELEELKFATLCNMPVHSALDEAAIATVLEQPLPIPGFIKQLRQTFVEKYVQEKKNQPTIEDMRQIEAMVYALAVGGQDDDETV